MSWRAGARTSVLGCAVRGRWKVVLPDDGKEKMGKEVGGWFWNFMEIVCKSTEEVFARLQGLVRFRLG